jgi:hypothetical protein
MTDTSDPIVAACEAAGVTDPAAVLRLRAALALREPVARSILTWGAPVVSVITILTYAVLSGIALALTMRGDLPASTVAILSLVLGAASANASQVIGFWVGSSAGSARKDEALASLKSGPS